LSRKIDIESALAEILAMIKAKLNTQIAAIEAEKVLDSAGIPGGLAAIDDAAYYEQTWSNNILNHPVAIFYGIENVNAKSLGPETAEEVTYFVEVVVSDSGMDVYGPKRILRYSRAIKEVIQNNFDKLIFGGIMKVETVRPVSFKLEEDASDEIRVGGVSLTLAIA
jgi:hypothetical protein